MNGLNNPLNWSTMAHVPFVMRRSGGKIRLIAGLAINVVGASMLLVYSARLLGFSI